MITTWIVTSAVATNVGIFDTDTRIRQTHGTIDSILNFYPDASIMLVEGGKKLESNHRQFQRLIDRCHTFIDCRDIGEIAVIHEHSFSRVSHRKELGGVAGLSKSMSELRLLQIAVSKMDMPSNPDHPVDDHRVFKISGRYRLSPIFDPNRYEQSRGRYVFGRRRPSWMKDAIDHIGTEFMYPSTLWSFPLSERENVISNLQNMIDNINDLKRHIYIDVEHLLFKYFSDKPSQELEFLHVIGSSAPTGSITYD